MFGMIFLFAVLLMPQMLGYLAQNQTINFFYLYFLGKVYLRKDILDNIQLNSFFNVISKLGMNWLTELEACL